MYQVWYKLNCVQSLHPKRYKLCVTNLKSSFCTIMTYGKDLLNILNLLFYYWNERVNMWLRRISDVRIIFTITWMLLIDIIFKGVELIVGVVCALSLKLNQVASDRVQYIQATLFTHGCALIKSISSVINNFLEILFLTNLIIEFFDLYEFLEEWTSIKVVFFWKLRVEVID